MVLNIISRPTSAAMKHMWEMVVLSVISRPTSATMKDMWEMMVLNVIRRPTSATMKHSIVVKISKYREREGFIKGTILFQWPWRCMAHPSVI